MLSLFVSGSIRPAAVNLNENKSSRVVGLLNNIEANDTGLINAGFGVLNRSGLEGLDTIRFNLNVNGEEAISEKVQMMAGSNICNPIFYPRVFSIKVSVASQWPLVSAAEARGRKTVNVVP